MTSAMPGERPRDARGLETTPKFSRSMAAPRLSLRIEREGNGDSVIVVSEAPSMARIELLDQASFGDLYGVSLPMRRLFATLDRVCSSDLHPRVFDLNELVRSMDRLLERVLGDDIELVARPSPKLDLVEADVGQIEQVVLTVNRTGERRQGTHFLAKPFTPDQLARTVRDVLDGAPIA